MNLNEATSLVIQQDFDTDSWLDRVLERQIPALVCV